SVEGPIPDAGLRLHVSGENLPLHLESIVGATSRGVHADTPTVEVPLVDVGSAGTAIPINLTNKAALIQRDDIAFLTKITNAAKAGALFAVIYNNSPVPVFAMGDTDYAPIPAVLIPQVEGELLRDYIATNSANATIQLTSLVRTLEVTNTLSCEHVGLRVKANHPLRGDLRITLTSPMGTRSILQQLNGDTAPFPQEWTYYSTHHFYESSAGTWTVAITDEFPEAVGSVLELELIIRGTAIVDSDRDGLDDTWELAHFGSLSANPQEDPDKDGYHNAREQILGTSPTTPNFPIVIDLSRLNTPYFRASWPGSEQFNYQVWSGANVGNLTLAATIPGRFPETEWIAPASNARRFVRVVAIPKP
ncbi:MAG: proprotein convertase P-domain-containing protein, partial [Limisphaerales bacterium]